MTLSDNPVCRLHIRNQQMPVLHLYPKLLLDGLMNVRAKLNIGMSCLILPVGIETNRYTLNPTMLTFHLSGSCSLRVLWTARIILFAVRPGYIFNEVHGGEFGCAGEECGLSLIHI